MERKEILILFFSTIRILVFKYVVDIAVVLSTGTVIKGALSLEKTFTTGNP